MLEVALLPMTTSERMAARAAQRMEFGPSVADRLADEIAAEMCHRRSKKSGPPSHPERGCHSKGVHLHAAARITWHSLHGIALWLTRRSLHAMLTLAPAPALECTNLPLPLTLIRRANPKHTDSKESIGLWPPGEWPLALPSIEHLTSSQAHARVKKDLRCCVAQSRGLGGFILQPLAEKSKP